MRLISNLKRASYLVVAGVLTLVAMPVVPISQAFAAGANTEVGNCDELSAALNDTDVSTIVLGSDISNCSYLHITSGKTINGNSHFVSFANGDNGFGIETDDAVIFNNMTISSSFDSITVGRLDRYDYALSADLTLNNVTINTGRRGISYNSDNYNGSSLTINDSVIQRSGISDYDTEYKTGEHSRGISFWEFQNSTATIKNTTIQGFSYDVNMACGLSCSFTGTIISLENVTLKGRAGFNVWSDKAKIDIVNSSILGINNQGGSQETFGNIVFNETASGNRLRVNNVKFSNSINGAGIDNPDAQQYMIDERGHNTSLLKKVDFVDNSPDDRLTSPVRKSGDGTVTVYSGTFDLPLESEDLAVDESGNKLVNYLVDGRYVVKSAPSLKTTPKKILVKVNEATTLDGIKDNTEFQESGIIIEATNGVTLDKAAGEVTAPAKGISNLKLGFEVYKNEDGVVTRDESFDKMVKVHAYNYNDLDTIYLNEDGGPFESGINVQLNSNVDSYELYVEKDEETGEDVATIDQDGVITPVGTGNAEIKLKVTINENQQSVTRTVGTVKVYSFEAEEEVTIPVGTEVNLQDGVISQVGNAGEVSVEVDDATVASLSGETAESTLTAMKAGTAELTFKVNGETIGTTTVKVFALQRPDDVVLKTLGSDAFDSIPVTMKFTNIITGDDTNLPSYTMSSSNSHVTVLGNSWLIPSTYKNSLLAVSAGDSVITVKYADDLETTETFNARVSTFTSTARNRYEMAAGDTISFRMNEQNNQAFVKCETDGHACEEDTNFEITQTGNNGTFRVTASDEIEAGTYTLTFTDTFTNVMKNGEPTDVKVAEEAVTIRIHEVEVLDEDGEEVSELFIKTDGDPAKVTVREKNNYSDEIGWTIRDDAGNLMLFDNRVEVSRSGEEVTVAVNEAGYYTIEFQDCNTTVLGYCLNPIASKTVEVYAIDFEVNDQEYHLSNKDTAEKMINAIHHYWDEHGGSTAAGENVTHSNGSVTTKIKVSKVASGADVELGDEYDFKLKDGAKADRYILALSAWIGDKQVDEKEVKIYVYEMKHPRRDEFYGEMKKTDTEYEFDGIDVSDRINDVVDDEETAPATITAEAIGDNKAHVTSIDVEEGTVTVDMPGKYVVRYTDTMRNGSVAETWDATFKVYGLDAEVPDGEFVNLNAGDTNYTYTMIHPQTTYGLVRITLTKEDPNGEITEFVEEHRYHGSATESDVPVPFTIDLADEDYGEGKYKVKIRNLSAKDHHFEEKVVGSFYVVNKEFDFLMVERGKKVDITVGSEWKLDEAYDMFMYATDITIDGQTATVDTTNMPLGVHRVYMLHNFGEEPDGGPYLPIKVVTIVVYEVVSSDDTKELNPEVTINTIKDLYERTAKATGELVRGLIKAGVPEHVVICSEVHIIDSTLEDCDWYKLLDKMVEKENLTKDDLAEIFGLDEEQVEKIDLDAVKALLANYKVAFGDVDDKSGLYTAATLNEINSLPAWWTFDSFDTTVETEVKVTDINGSVDPTEKAAIEKELAPYNVDHIDYYDVSVLLKIDGEEFGKLHKLNGEITVALAKTSDPATGYTRQYFVVRDHNGTVTVLTEGVDFYIENGVIYVISDEFSTYAVAYKDTLIPKSPDTGEEVTAEAGATSVNQKL